MKLADGRAPSAHYSAHMANVPDLDPRQHLAAWLPHLTLLLLFSATIVGLLYLLAPIANAMLCAGGLALLTHSISYAPIYRIAQQWFPHWKDYQRRYVAALAATLGFAIITAAILLGIIWALTGSVMTTVQGLIGIALHDQQRIHQFVEHLMQRVDLMSSFYPTLPIDQSAIRQWLEANLNNSAVSQAVMNYLVSGTGSVLAQLALAGTALFYLHSEGHLLNGYLLNCLPLSVDQRQQINNQFTKTVLHLWLSTGAQAAAHGIAIGTIAWLIGGFNPILVGLTSGFVALLPIVGPTVAWLPLASLLWPINPWSALLLSAACLVSTTLINWQFRRLAVRLDTHHLWLDFLLFLGLVGGVLSMGLLGFILGPALVLITASLGKILPLLYHRQQDA